MIKVLRRGILGIGLLTATGYGTTCYVFPEIRENHHEVYKAAQRTARFFWTASRLAYIYKYNNDPEEERHALAADILYNCLHKNGGLGIKLGQAIGASNGLIPQEYITKMSNFFQKAKESSFEDVKQQIEENSKQKMEELFRDFDPKPISAASIAQVHIAHLKDGQKVAVKVQHRWLKEQCYGDLKIVALLTHLAEYVFPGFKYKWYSEELSKMLPRELDFTAEAKNAERTRELFKNNPNIEVPRVYNGYSSDKVLIMEYVNGVAVTKAKEIQDMGINLKDVAKLLNHCFSQQIFEFGHVHGDPHPGNIFVTAQKDFAGKIKPKITLLDHGLYQELSEDVKLQYSYLWKGILTRNETMIREAADKLNVGRFYQLLAIMVAKKDYKDIMNVNEKDFNQRLKNPTKEEQIEMMKQVDAEVLKEITVLFSQMNKDVLLLFKVNDFIRAITSRLGSPVKQYEIMAKYCFDSVERKELEENKGMRARFRFWLQRSATLWSLKLAGFYYSFVSLFKTPNIPDELMF